MRQGDEPEPGEPWRKPDTAGSFAAHLPIILVGLVFSARLALAVEPPAVTFDSPRLAKLRAALDAGDSSAEAAFWQEMKEQGTPLVEPVEGSPDHNWVTFCWKGDVDTKNVVLAGGVAKEHPFDNRLQRLEGTNVWYATRKMRNDLRTVYLFSVNDPLVVPDWNDSKALAARMARMRKDPLSRNQNVTGSVIELASAPPQPWIKPNVDAPPGTLLSERIHSEILNNDRQITVYRPPNYAPEHSAYPLLLVFDLDAYTTMVPTPTILNNMIHAGKIPPVVAVLVGNAPGARNKELPCNELFARFLAEELLPWVRERHHVTRDPKQVVVAGSSFGGLAATYFAFQHPELAGNVLSQSGSYWWWPGNAESQNDPAVEKEWLTRQFAAAPKKEIRFYLEAGLHESLLTDNRHFRTVLAAKGYEILRYSEYNGGHDYLCWRGSLSDGLILLVGPAAALPSTSAR